ncbi:hybrid sensor histidine kinase/response regulator [Solimonas soli]|uniref:PAS domain-containing hybrid sensor histidine kinase/response regulator n=1 Tax=Solimonas soli TaxID=413479 RepID=UPI003F4F4DE8
MPDQRRAVPLRLRDSWAVSDSDYRLLVDAVSDYAIFMLDPGGHVLTWNTGARKLKGYEAEQIIGRHFSVFYPQSRIDEGWPEQELRAAIELGRFEDEGWRVRADGSLFWANVIITKLVDQNGEFRGFSKITRDLTERRQQEELLRLSEERFRLIVDGVKDYAIFMLDPAGRIASWNAGAQHNTGYEAIEVIGQPATMFHPPELISSGTANDELRIALREGRHERIGWCVRKDGSRFWASIVLTALHDPSGRHRGFANITRDLTDRRRISTLEDESRRITTFLAMLGHELRNPLAPIVNALHIMERADRDEEAARGARQVIGGQVRHITRMVDDLLDIGRITSGKIHIERKPLQLSEALHEVVDTLMPALREKRHSLQTEIDDASLWILGDRTRVVQIVNNLLANAIKFTPEGGRIGLSMSKRGGKAEIFVRDNGPGIAPELLPKIFNLFVQGDQDMARPQGGLGLGLSLVQQMVALHGGDVTAHSTGNAGEGAEFELRLPLIPAPAALPGPRPTRALRQPARILIVDDNRDAADTMAYLFETFGYEATTAYDGHAALAAVNSRRPDVVLLDIGLPGLSGLDVARIINVGREAPLLIAVSGYGQDKDRAASLEAGFRAHLTKPVNANELLAYIEQLLGERDSA